VGNVATPPVPTPAQVGENQQQLNIDWKSLAIVAAAGAIGGLGAGILTQVTRGGLFGGLPWYQDLPAEMFFGMLAAEVGVYFFMKTNVLAAPTLVFALMCGLTWNAVITGAQSYTKEFAAKQNADSSSAAATQLNNLSQQSPQLAATQVQGAVNTLTQPLSQLRNVDQEDEKATIIDSASGVIHKVVEATNVDASTKIDALQKIGIASASSSPTTSLKAIAALDSVAKQAPDLAVRQKATGAIVAIQEQNTALKPIQ
jgi:hypothetical protein